jgi:hypothetical protein
MIRAQRVDANLEKKFSKMQKPEIKRGAPCDAPPGFSILSRVEAGFMPAA